MDHEAVKTMNMDEMLDQLVTKVICITHLPWLVKEKAEEFELKEFSGSQLYRMSICYDELYKINPNDFKNYILVLDDVIATLFNTLNRKNKFLAKCHHNFMELITICKQTYMSDACVDEFFGTYIGKLIYRKRNLGNFHHIDNQTEPKIYPKEKLQIYDTQEKILNVLKHCIKKQKIFIICDTEEFIKSLEIELKNTYQINTNKIKVIDSKELLKNFNFKDLSMYDYVICTPWNIAGLSNIQSHFDSIFGFFGNKTSTPYEALHSLRRVRTCKSNLTKAWIAQDIPNQLNFEQIQEENQPTFLNEFNSYALSDNLNLNDLKNDELYMNICFIRSLEKWYNFNYRSKFEELARGEFKII